MTDYISRADAIEVVESLPNTPNGYSDTYDKACIIGLLESLPSADAEPKWNCTASFVAEQLDRLRKMTDEEKWNFFREFFGMGDAVQGEWIKRGTKITCSHCKSAWSASFDTIIVGMKYCPNCGARMKGGDDE